MNSAGIIAYLLFTCFLTTYQYPTIGYDIWDRTHVDLINLIIVLPDLTLPSSGEVVSWTVFARRTGPLKLLVLRPVSSNTYQLIHELTSTDSGPGIHDVTADPELLVHVGDCFGLFTGATESEPIVPYESSASCTSPVLFTGLSNPIPTTYTVRTAGCRKYSMQVEYACEYNVGLT